MAAGLIMSSSFLFLAQGLLPGGGYQSADRSWHPRRYDRRNIDWCFHECPVRRGAQLQPDEDQSQAVGHGEHWKRRAAPQAESRSLTASLSRRPWGASARGGLLEEQGLGPPRGQA